VTNSKACEHRICIFGTLNKYSAPNDRIFNYARIGGVDARKCDIRAAEVDIIIAGLVNLQVLTRRDDNRIPISCRINPFLDRCKSGLMTQTVIVIFNTCSVDVINLFCNQMSPAASGDMNVVAF